MSDEEFTMELSVNEYVKKHSDAIAQGKPIKDKSWQQNKREKLGTKTLGIELPIEIINEFKQVCIKQDVNQTEMFKALLQYWKS